MSADISRRGFLGGALAGAALAGCRTKGPVAHVPSSGKIPYRVFWTWDNSHNWNVNVPGSQNAGIGNPYLKSGEWFERDYRRSIDWCAAHGIDAVGVVGLLRDCHGGVDAARRICGYAREKGVRVYLISGLYTYGGVYYEGNSQWSMERWFAKNKDAIGRTRDGAYLCFRQRGYNGCVSQFVGCPSNAKMNRYILDSLNWVFTAIPELGGIQMETGDTRVCWCPTCTERRGAQAANEDMSVEDMIAAYPDAVAAVRAANPDAWVMCETYPHFNDEPCRQFYRPDAEAVFTSLKAMSSDVFWQWKCDRRLRDGSWRGTDRLPPVLKRFRHMMRAHSGTQWWGGRATWAVDLIRRQCRLSSASGICGVSLFGEISPYRANAEFNYLALQYFADYPENTEAQFARDVMSPLLGGDAFAEKYAAYAPLQYDVRGIPSALADIAKIIGSVRDSAARRRWLWLADNLAGYRWNSDHFPKGRPRPNYARVTNQV